MMSTSHSLQSIIDYAPIYRYHGLFDHRSTIVLCLFAPIMSMLSIKIRWTTVSWIHYVYRIKTHTMESGSGTCSSSPVYIRNWVHDCPCCRRLFHSFVNKAYQCHHYHHLSTWSFPIGSDLLSCVCPFCIFVTERKGNQVGPSSFFRISRKVTKWKLTTRVPSSPICWQHDYPIHIYITCKRMIYNKKELVILLNQFAKI